MNYAFNYLPFQQPEDIKSGSRMTGAHVEECVSRDWWSITIHGWPWDSSSAYGDTCAHSRGACAHSSWS